ncbi:hypothetical protein, partial [Citrobacter braakii]
PAYGPQNDVTLKMPAFEWVHVQLHQQKGMISLSPPTICNSANLLTSVVGMNISKTGNYIILITILQIPLGVIVVIQRCRKGISGGHDN